MPPVSEVEDLLNTLDSPNLTTEEEGQLLAVLAANIEEQNIREGPMSIVRDAEAVGIPPMAIQRTHDGTRTLYRTDDGSPRTFGVHMITALMQKKYPDGPLRGQRVFSLRPTKKFQGGETKCHLHPEHPSRPQWNAMGLTNKVCHTAHLASEGEAIVHMRLLHKSEQRIWEESEQRQRQDEEREFMREQVKAFRTMVANTSRGGGGTSTPKVVKARKVKPTPQPQQE